MVASVAACVCSTVFPVLYCVYRVGGCSLGGFTCNLHHHAEMDGQSAPQSQSQSQSQSGSQPDGARADTRTLKLTPAQVVEEYKKQGHFDVARNVLVKRLQTSESGRALMAKIERLVLEQVRAEQDQLCRRDRKVQEHELMRFLERQDVFAACLPESDSESLKDQQHVVREVIAELDAAAAANPQPQEQESDGDMDMDIDLAHA